MSSKKAGFIINDLHREAWESLPDERCGQLLKILIRYQFDGVLPTKLTPELNMAFSFLKPLIDKQKKDYEETCVKRREAAHKRWGGADE